MVIYVSSGDLMEYSPHVRQVYVKDGGSQELLTIGRCGRCEDEIRQEISDSEECGDSIQ